ncbi:MAG: SH3 domain-containing protein, partial [Chloroflexota bacterium]|nr:SH3 domain-containing protein [Chloroflexota bacterium]
MYVNAARQGFNGANVRARPDQSSRKVDELDNGTAVEAVVPAIHGTDGQSWYRITSPAEGYVLESLLSDEEPAVSHKVTYKLTGSAVPVDIFYSNQSGGDSEITARA